MSKDIKYDARIDMQKYLNSIKQIIPDLNDANVLNNPPGTNYLVRGSSLGEDDQDTYE